MYKEIQCGGAAKTYMTNGLFTHGEIFAYLLINFRKPLLIYDFANAPLWISLYVRKIWFSFLSVYGFRNSRIKVGHDDDLSNLFERINPPLGEGGEEGGRNDTKIRQAWPACDCGVSDTALTSLSICAYVCPPPGPDEQAYRPLCLWPGMGHSQSALFRNGFVMHCIFSLYLLF